MVELEELTYWHVLWRDWEKIRRKARVDIEDLIGELQAGSSAKDIVGHLVSVSEGDYEEVKSWLKKGVRLVPMLASEYPNELRKYKPKGRIYPPPLLYYKGCESVSLDKCIAIVGTRSASLHGRICAREVAMALAELGVVVVTGFARGIDTEATCGALQARGTLVAVLPWLEPIYPPENERLSVDVTRKGLLISENLTKPADKSVKSRIYLRNRIIAGMSKAVIVIETGRTGGSFYQVEYALKREKTVYVMEPDKNHEDLVEGYKRFVSQGAVPFSDIGDLLNQVHQL